MALQRESVEGMYLEARDHRVKGTNLSKNEPEKTYIHRVLSYQLSVIWPEWACLRFSFGHLTLHFVFTIF